jgi:hypothetical protein
MRALFEMPFNVLYLITICCLVGAMWRRRRQVADADRRTAAFILLAFLFLALGDAAHVGFQVLAFALNKTAEPVTIFGSNVFLVPLGGLATAVTFTLFYGAMILAWAARCKKDIGIWGWALFALALIRCCIMMLPGNHWNTSFGSAPLYIYRNIPLMLMQLGLAALILRDSLAAGDAMLRRIAVLILVSFACYAPVVFLYDRFPAVGMLMIPKTICYVTMGILAFREFYIAPGTAPLSNV